MLPQLAGMLDSHRHSRATGFFVAAACRSQASVLILGEAVCATFDEPSMLGWLPAAVLAVHGKANASAR